MASVWVTGVGMLCGKGVAWRNRGGWREGRMRRCGSCSVPSELPQVRLPSNAHPADGATARLHFLYPFTFS